MSDGYASDMASAAGLKPLHETAACDVYVLPDEAWARRASGEIANQLVRRFPDRAHAVVVPNTSTCNMVSLRVPAHGPRRADEFCRGFPSGGGRGAAGGINHLPQQGLEDFVRQFLDTFS